MLVTEQARYKNSLGCVGLSKLGAYFRGALQWVEYSYHKAYAPALPVARERLLLG